MRNIQSRPIDLFQTERLHLRPLPPYIPEVYADHSRSVDLEGYVHLHTNRYSVADKYIGHQLKVRETKDKVRILEGHHLLAEHVREPERAHKRCTLPEHRHPGRRSKPGVELPSLPEEQALRAAGPELSSLVELLRKKHGGRAARQVRKLYRFFQEYPTEALCEAVRTALEYGLDDLDRIERMILRLVAGNYFMLPIGPISDGQEDDNG